MSAATFASPTSRHDSMSAHFAKTCVGSVTAAPVAALTAARRPTRRSALVVAAVHTAPTHGKYVITGGLGGLGLRAAKMLIEVGVSRVLLASRNARVVRDGQGLGAQLYTMGAVAAVLECDSADTRDTDALLLSAKPLV